MQKCKNCSTFPISIRHLNRFLFINKFNHVLYVKLNNLIKT